MTTTPLLLGAWAELLFETLAQAGLREVVVSPGSRSTPFVIGAARCPRLRIHDVIDERAAAFFALGQARASGRASLLLCTSGSAGAHYLPAIIEASQSHLPLLVLTADRPFELQGCGAPQTIDQIKLYGDHVRRFIELGMPDGSPGALRALRRTVVQALHYAQGAAPGPVHLNARARKPLEPGEPGELTPADADLLARVRLLAAEPLTRAISPKPHITEHDALALADALRASPAGLIVCGPQREDTALLQALAARTGYPLLCEAPSQLRFAPLLRSVQRCGAFDALLRNRRVRHSLQPDIILQVGQVPTSSGYEQLLSERPALRRLVFAAQGWPDPHSSAELVVQGETSAWAPALLAELPPRAAPPSPLARFLEAAEQRVFELVARTLETTPDLSEGMAVRLLLRHLPQGALLVLGNSLPIREVDRYCPPGDRAIEVLCQRGANGIDGIVSGAVGAASVSRRPVAVLLGDVSFLHDLSGLILARELRDAPFVVLVIHNNGGRIFDQLPVGRAVSPAELVHFTTPHQLQLGPAAQLCSHAHQRVTDPGALEAALRAALRRPGCSVIEAVVPPEGAQQGEQRLADLIDEDPQLAELLAAYQGSQGQVP